jgi:hypothetical protein
MLAGRGRRLEFYQTRGAVAERPRLQEGTLWHSRTAAQAITACRRKRIVHR